MTKLDRILLIIIGILIALNIAVKDNFLRRLHCLLFFWHPLEISDKANPHEILTLAKRGDMLVVRGNVSSIPNFDKVILKVHGIKLRIS